VFRFFEPVIRPVLTAARPRVVVEVGAGAGPNTALLLEWAERDAPRCTVHVVDPAPAFAVEEAQERYGKRLVFHRALSLNVLARIERPDVVLIDGDHNWYTVFHELQLLARSAHGHDRPFPITFLHDVDWPYGRRDLYYDPDVIPDAYRQAYRRAGLVPGDTNLHDDGGLNRSLANAIYEHDVRNGVRTAVEDFVAESGKSLRFLSLPGDHGLGLLVDPEQAAPRSRLARVLNDLESTAFLREQCLRIERERIEARIEAAAAQRAHEKSTRREQKLRQQSEELAGDLEQLRGQAQTAAAARAEAVAKLATRSEAFAHERKHLRATIEQKTSEARKAREAARAEIDRALAAHANAQAELAACSDAFAEERRQLQATIEHKTSELDARTDAFERQRERLERRPQDTDDRSRSLEEERSALEKNVVEAGLNLERAAQERTELERRLADREARVQALVQSRRRQSEDLQARSLELRDRTVVQISADLEQVRRDLERVADSHAWRLGHAVMRFLRLITFRRPSTGGGVARALDRLSRIDVPLPHVPAALPSSDDVGAQAERPSSGNGGPLAAGATRGAVALQRTGRRDYTADGFIVDEQWRDLFTEDEREAARHRLAADEEALGS